MISQMSVMLGMTYNLYGQLEYFHVITNFDLLLFIISNSLFC
jgi:hypothetical protein